MIAISLLAILVSSLGLAAISWWRADYRWIYVALFVNGVARAFSAAGQVGPCSVARAAQSICQRRDLGHVGISIGNDRGTGDWRLCHCGHRFGDGRLPAERAVNIGVSSVGAHHFDACDGEWPRNA